MIATGSHLPLAHNLQPCRSQTAFGWLKILPALENLRTGLSGGVRTFHPKIEG